VREFLSEKKESFFQKDARAFLSVDLEVFSKKLKELFGDFCSFSIYVAN
jgi:hypothetical protein